MAFTWTAKKLETDVKQVQFKVLSDSKKTGILGTISLAEDETTSDPLVDWVKASLGSSMVAEFESEAANIDDSPPPVPFS